MRHVYSARNVPRAFAGAAAAVCALMTVLPTPPLQAEKCRAVRTAEFRRAARADGPAIVRTTAAPAGIETGMPVIRVGLSPVPKLGFQSTFGNAGGAAGEYVRSVRAGSPAQRMKLLPGDAILAVNGLPLKSADSWYEAIEQASRRDGWVTLKIRCGRTGAMEYRTVNLFKLQRP